MADFSDNYSNQKKKNQNGKKNNRSHGAQNNVNYQTERGRQNGNPQDCNNRQNPQDCKD